MRVWGGEIRDLYDGAHLYDLTKPTAWAQREKRIAEQILRLRLSNGADVAYRPHPQLRDLLQVVSA